MIILNNPVNPTGTHVGTDTQREIIKIARQHNLYVHCDEIFRPLYHTTTKSDIPASMVEYPDLKYDRVITTSSLSKCYGLSGIRIGWIATRSPELLAKFVNYRMYSVQALSMLDEVVATEVLSPRCRPSILQKHLALAKHNLNLIEAFVDKHEIQCEWTRPTAGAVAFVKFKNARSGEPVDDMDFCERLVASKGVLLSPATLCFEFDEAVPPADDALKMKGAEGLEEFKGRVRLHFTCNTEVLEKGLRGLAEFLEEEE
ncbi:hypothetical protein LTR64_003094 [Lithohypha guttulata]|uniref:uncharacterized protein n=1 Tax=Lithohypha guttulata TaxID=1690604 RepID=UPI002DE007E6|nr:hypothetical protein LTR51_000684 [Lithohypha guttulata]